MQKKSHKPTTSETTENTPSISVEELQNLQNQASEAEAKKQEYLDALLRERADFTNFRRRIESEKSQMWAQASDETIKKLLPVLDDLERAMANRPAGNAWADGVEMVIRKFQSILDKEGITRIQAEGQPFDPNLHEAIMQEESPNHESGLVIAVLQQGYMHGERVLRPAMVKVAA
ncbi:MAG: nucleotide exchange factor GrpE [Chloroflexi bacterium HGW-Chloroflexi-6]|nr:MAG: nucleotide exchange factor GrpE [Chloroflexi bacterium HGW-Chloroflexi-6]